MKYIFALIFLIFSIITFSQEQDNEIYHSEKKYEYTKFDDKDLVKMKTELYIRRLKNEGFVINKNQIKEYKFDINVSNEFKDKNILSFNLVFSFFDTFYTVDLWSPKIYIAKKKQWISINKINPEYDKLREAIEKLSFDEYENDVNANF
ncbi:hypothetical protein [Chryseobacterium aureum]|uniref:hypothetical protein n=1 Tax=Chryseobacterium aureum TaxID=2497456 RepID=UPI000F86B5D8|nr:hypothetical protein [Chryseobacterium aureum]